jgi:hypothetical protein
MEASMAVETFEQIRQGPVSSFEELRRPEISKEMTELLFPLNRKPVIPQPFNDIVEQAFNPEEEKMRLLNTMYFAEKYKARPSTVYHHVQDIAKQNWGEDLTQAQIYQKIGESIMAEKRAKLQDGFMPLTLLGQGLLKGLAEKPAASLRGIQAYTPGEGLGADWLLRKTSEYIAGIPSDDTIEAVNVAASGKLWPIAKGDPWYNVKWEHLPETVNAWSATVGEQIPIIAMTWVGRIVGKVIGKPVGAAMGITEAAATAGPDPTDVVAAPLVAKLTAKTIEHLSGAAPLVAMEAGYFMDRADELGIDRDIRDKYARLYGVGSGSIEYLQNIWMLKAYTRFATPKAVRTVAKKVLYEIGGGIWEGLEEFSQNGLENFLIGKAIAEQKARTPGYNERAPKITEGGGRAFTIGLGVSMITRLPGHAYTSARKETIARQIVKRTNTSLKEARVLVSAVAEGAITQEEFKKVIEEATPEPTAQEVPPIQDMAEGINKELAAMKEEKAEVSTAKREQAISIVRGIMDSEQYASLAESDRVEIGIKMLAERGIDVTAEELTQPSDVVEKAPSKPVEPTEEEIEQLPVKERAAVQKVEAEIQAEDSEIVKPNLYIGNVTGRMKSVFARIFGKTVDDVKGFLEGAYPTKRAPIEMTKAEARIAVEELEEDLIEKLDNNQIQTESQLSLANAMWGNIKELRAALGEKVGGRPFAVQRAGKPVTILYDPTQTLSEMFNKEQLVQMAEDLGLDVEGTKAEIVARLEKAADEGMSKAQKVVAEAKEVAKNQAQQIIRTMKAKIMAGIKPTESANLTVAQVLQTTMKRMSQAARKAYAKGKAATRWQRRHARLQQKALRKLKARIKKAAKTISAKIPKSVDFEYREAIEVLRMGIDPELRSAKTIRHRKASEEYFARNPKNVPIKLMKKLFRKSVGEYTVAELEDVAHEIEQLTKQGKLKRKLQLQNKQKSINEVVDKIEEGVSKGEMVKAEKKVVIASTKEGLVKTAQIVSRAWTLTLSRIFDMLDGAKRTFSGVAHRFFYDQVNRATDAKLRAIDKRKEAGEAKMKMLGLTYWGLSDSRIVDGMKFTVDEMIGVYNANKNRLAKLAIMYGNGLTEGNIDHIIAALTDAEKAWGDYIVQDYADRYNRLRQEVINVENRDMGFEENYTPMRRTNVDYTTHTEEVIAEILQKEGLRKAYAEHGMTIKRKEVPAEFQKPIRLSATGVWLSQVAKQEHYIHFAQLAKDLHKVAEGIKEVVEKQFGREYNKVIKNYIDRVANPNSYRSFNAFENLSRRLRQNAVLAYLAYNLVTMAKQVPSIFLYMADAGPTSLLSSAVDFISNPQKMWDMVREKDPQVKHRAIERELEELKTNQPERYWAIVNKVGGAGLQGIYFFDGVVRTIGWNAVYQKSLANGSSEVEAIRQAQNATLRTQPAAAPKDLPQLYTTNEVLNWFTMFTNQLNKLYNIATYDFTGYVNNGDYQKAFLSMSGIGIAALVIWIIANRRLPKDAEDLADAIVEQAINMTPLIGKSIMVGKRGWGDTEIPAFELPKAGARALAAVAKGDFNEKDMLAIAEGIAVTLGLPYIGTKRALKTVETGEPKELIGGGPKEKDTGKRKLVSGR